jgi:hypothetical protein
MILDLLSMTVEQRWWTFCIFLLLLLVSILGIYIKSKYPNLIANRNRMKDKKNRDK